ncbi:EF-P lysine aminoacylase EpmA [Persicimonas caeni]|nr:EF-P lysine aminoacylase EpmA [Persicimonas caeni]
MADSNTPRTPSLASERSLSAARSLSLEEAMRLRARANRQIRAFFDARDFLEVETPNWVAAPGTDVHLDPVRAVYEDRHGDLSVSGYLHTSPEFAMKRLLVEGLERIWQMCKVWRNGEVTPLHNPEFTLLEWYRAGEPVEAIIDDVEALTRELLGDEAMVVTDDEERRVDLSAPFERMTMQQVVEGACGFDLLEALDFDALYAACEANDLLSPRSLARAGTHRQWDELFFELQVTYIDPFLADRGAVFVTDWPTPLAVLARKKPADPRVAERFELYVGGVELANGFGELTDPVEQHARFEHDLETRRERGLPDMPMPERFLAALERGMPASSGVAVGVDRLLMLACGAADIREVVPFAMRRDAESGDVEWG